MPLSRLAMIYHLVISHADGREDLEILSRKRVENNRHLCNTYNVNLSFKQAIEQSNLTCWVLPKRYIQAFFREVAFLLSNYQ